MAKETEIVNIINARLSADLHEVKFNGKAIKGIVYSVIKDSATNEKLSYPLNNNEGIDIQFNDNSPIQIHHRHISNSAVRNNDKSINDVAEMRMYVTALRTRIGMTNDSLKDFMCSLLNYDLSPSERSTLNVRFGTVQFTGANMDSIRLYSQEYGKALTRPDIIMIEVAYNIECKYNIACINSLCFIDN